MMTTEANPSPRRVNLLLFSFFCAGIIAGMSITFGFGIFGTVHNTLKSYAASQLGKFLDTDFVYLRTGETLEGLIISEDPKSIGIELNNRTVKVDPKDVLKIEKNYYTRYVKGPW